MEFTDTKILLSNYPRIRQEASFQKVGSKEILDIQCGYDCVVNPHQITLQIADDLITAILAFDNIYIEGNNIWDVIQVFGSEYITELLKCDILHFIPDNNLNPVMMKSNNKWAPDFFGYTSGILNKYGKTIFKPTQNEWGEIETTLYHKNIKGPHIQMLLYLIDEKKKVIDQTTIKELTIKETQNDLMNKYFAETNNILRINSSGLKEYHKMNILRLHELNTVSVTAGLLGANAVKTDGQINNLMNQKLSSIFMNKLKDGISDIQSILQKKGFPNLGELFVNKVIDLEDILKLRNSLQGRLFRYWAENDDYDEKQMERDIMNSIHKIPDFKISDALRFTACSVVGLISPISGIAVSAFDSFIIDKIANGWHPNFFLDNKLKATIDKCIKEKENIEKIKLQQERFKGIGRNDTCPCGSGLKFKKCHGKNIL